MSDPLTILVVDDEPSVRETVRKMLEDEGFVTRTAADGLDALKALASGSRISCVVTDMVMPEMDGITLAMKLHEARPGLPVVVISGRVDLAASSIQGLAPLMNSEVGCLLKKPFTKEQLVDAIRRSLARACGEV